MKTLPLWLALSVAANLGLAVSIYSHRPRFDPPVMTPNAPGADSTAKGVLAASPITTKPAQAGLNSAEGDAAYVARLRAAGFPESIVRTLVESRLYERYAERMRNLRHFHPYEYWRDSIFSSYDSMSREERAAMRALSEERMAEVKKILGEEAVFFDDQKAYRERTMGNLSPEKIQQVEAINKDYSELMNQISDRTKGVMLKSDREALRLLEKEKRADLAAALTPEELLEYDLRSSPSASSMRQRLRYFEPTEAEFRTLAQLQLELDQTFGTSNLSAAEKDRRSAAEKEFPAKIQAVLTPERFADYQITTDGSFGNNAYSLRSLGFELDAVKEVTAFQRTITQRADAIRTQTGLSPAQRVDALAALEQEANSWLSGKLGEKSLLYQKSAGGSWLVKLHPAPPRSPSP